MTTDVVVSERPVEVLVAPPPSAEAFIRSRQELAGMFERRKPDLTIYRGMMIETPEPIDPMELAPIEEPLQETTELPALWLVTELADVAVVEPGGSGSRLWRGVMVGLVLAIPFWIGAWVALRMLAVPS